MLNCAIDAVMQLHAKSQIVSVLVTMMVTVA